MIVFKTYSAWDKQYILDTMLRDAVILLRPVEVKKLIEIGANINCNQFPQVKRLRILPRLYSTGIWSIRGRHPMSRTINLMVIKLDKAYFDIFSLSQAMRKNLYTAMLWKQNQMKLLRFSSLPGATWLEADSLFQSVPDLDKSLKGKTETFYLTCK